MCTPEELFGYNYCYVPTFKRYYFILNIVEETTNIWNIYCEVDVLATFRADILKAEAFVERAESMYDCSIPDDMLPRTIRSTQRVGTQIALGGLSMEGTYVLSVVSEDSNGKTGSAVSIALSQGQFASLAQKLYSTELLDSFKEYLANPLDYVVSCIWTPLGAWALEGSASFVVNGELIAAGSGVAQTVEYSTTMTVPTGYVGMRYNAVGGSESSYADYRNAEPYSEYGMWLPGVGLVSFPADAVFGDSSANGAPEIKVIMTASPLTGDVVYRVERVHDVTSDGIGAEIITAKGNFAVNIPVANVSRNFGTGAGGVATGATAMIAGAVTGNARLLTTGAAGALMSGISYEQKSVDMAGSLGGWAFNEDMITKIGIFSRSFAVSDLPANVRRTIGLPLYRQCVLGTLSGFVSCKNARIYTWATSDEYNRISQYVNNYSRDGYGGVIIE